MRYINRYYETIFKSDLDMKPWLIDELKPSDREQYLECKKNEEQRGLVDYSSSQSKIKPLPDSVNDVLKPKSVLDYLK